MPLTLLELREQINDLIAEDREIEDLPVRFTAQPGEQYDVGEVGVVFDFDGEDKTTPLYVDLS